MRTLLVSCLVLVGAAGAGIGVFGLPPCCTVSKTVASDQTAPDVTPSAEIAEPSAIVSLDACCAGENEVAMLPVAPRAIETQSIVADVAAKASACDAGDCPVELCDAVKNSDYDCPSKKGQARNAACKSHAFAKGKKKWAKSHSKYQKANYKEKGLPAVE